MADIVVLVLAMAAIASVGVHTLLTGVPPTPTSPRVRRLLLDMVPADLTGTVLDMGSGFGGLARGLARHCPDANVVGYERSPLPWLVSRLWQLLRPLPNLRLIRGDFRDAPLESASLVACYLIGPIMADLAPDLAARLAPGATAICNTFALPGWRAIDCRIAGDLYRSPVFLYRVPDSLPG